MNNNESTRRPSEEEMQEKALADLSSLSRVSHKLAMTSGGAPLEKVLSVLLPRLLVRVGSNKTLQQECMLSNNTVLKETLDKIHAKLVEIMSHVISRVRAEETCRLPVLGILQLLYDENTLEIQPVDVFTMNLALTFLNLGVMRCFYETVETLLPGLLLLLATHSGVASQASASLKSQSHQVAHLLLKAMERMVTEEGIHNNVNQTVLEQARRLCSDKETVSSALFDLCMDVVLYQPSSSQTMPPPGLSQAGHERLLSNQEWATAMRSSNRLKNFKVIILNCILPTKRWSLFMNNTRGMARTVALLVAATGTGHVDVVDRATLALKTHFDNMRERNETTQATMALGEPLSLSCTLLSLILGDSNAESALSQVEGLNSEMLRLGQTATATNDDVTFEYSTQLILSTKRRMASDQTAAAILSFLSTKVLDDNPHFLETLSSPQTRALATLAVNSAHKLLTTTGTSTLSTLRAAPYIAAAQLLNSLCIRLTALNEMPAVDVLAKALTTVCLVLSQAATPRPLASTPGTCEGSIAMRDACYGVVCALSRSRHAESFIFSCGRVQEDTAASMDTATLLFQCAANEEETLRPRAVAALDALLGAYCRVYVTLQHDNEEEIQEMSVMEMDTTEEANPWSQMEWTVSDTKLSDNKSDATMRDNEGLARALLPLLWSAAQSSQPKASRVAAARWSSELLKTLDLPNACHILCFLAGDKDVTAAAIAREGLGLDKMIGEAHDEQETGSDILPDFSDLALVLFSESHKGTSMTSWRPRYFDFSYHGKAAALRFGLVCLLSDLYGGEDDAVAAYVNALSETLTHFGTASRGRGSAHGRESIDLLDECSICLATCLSTCRFARSMILSGRTTVVLEDIEALAILADSSKARRYLAEACGCVYEDQDLWQNSAGVNLELDEWANKCQILRPLRKCAKELTDMQTGLFQAGEVHGAAFLGARCCRAFRLLAAKAAVPSNTPVNEYWEAINSIVEALGRGTVHSDEIIGNAFSQSLSIALSYDGVDAPILDSRIYVGTTKALTFMDKALRKYSNGDHTDETRASSLAHATGIVLAASTSAAGHVSNESSVNQSTGPARIQCVDALFTLIGSNAFRKDPEVALVAGEALADYADAYGPDGIVWSSSATEWPDTFNEEYANKLPPHQQVSLSRLPFHIAMLSVFLRLNVSLNRFCMFC